MSNEKRLYRSRDDRKVAGVCAGLGKYFNIEPTIMRLIFVLAAIFTAIGPVVLLYILLVVIIPEEP